MPLGRHFSRPFSFLAAKESYHSASNRAFQERVDGLQQRALLVWWQFLDLLQPAKHPQAGPVAKRRLSTVGLKQSVGGNLQRGGETQNHVGVHAKTVAFVVGDKNQ